MDLRFLADTDDRSRLFWRLQALGWGGILLLTVGIGGLVYSSVSAGLFAGTLRSAFGFAVSCVVLRPALRRIRARGRWPSALHLVLVALACALLGILTAFVIGESSSLLLLDLDQPGVRPFLAASSLLSGALYGLWCVLYFFVHYWLDTQRDQLRMAHAEAATRAGELQMLRAQINPHFLFNALNSILAESTDPASVRRVTLALADYLRFSLGQRDEKELLGKELAALENYLRVEKTRFEQDLEYRIETDDLASLTPAPVALVQPLVENAIKYGQRSTIRPLRVEVSARVEGSMLQVCVSNSGEWIEEKSSTRTGLANLRRRLDLLYRGRAEFRIETGGGRVKAHVNLPLEPHGGPA